MATYSRLDSYILACDLASDPFGKVHRGLTITGSRFDHHKLIRTFSDELVNAGISSKIEGVSRTAGALAGSRSFCSGYQANTGKTPAVACDYLGGRSLAQLIQKAKLEQLPLGVDHALSVLQGICQGLTLMHTNGIGHGVLSPHSIWVTFEGSTHIMDAPFAKAIHGLLPSCPQLAHQLEPYRAAQGVSALQQDLFSLGAILYELITFDQIPSGSPLANAIDGATLKAAQEDSPVPSEIKTILRRMLLLENPFETPQAFTAELERVLYDGDFSPTTFNMAFFMHTAFREENEQDNSAMKGDTTADYTPMMSSEGGAHGIEGLDTGKYIRYALIGGGTLAILLGGLFYSNHLKNRTNIELQARIAKMEEDAKASQEKLLELQKTESSLAAREAKAKEALKTGSKEEQARVAKELKAIQEEKARVQQQKDEASRASQVLQQNLQAMAKQVQTETPAPPPPPVQQVAQAAPQAAPQLAPPPAAQPPVPAPAPAPVPTPAAATPVPETDVQILRQAAPGIPPQARAMSKTTRKTGTFLVRVRVYVDANGRAARTVIDQDSGVKWGLEDAAEKAAQESSYKPATKGGKNATGWITLTYKFNF